MFCLLFASVRCLTPPQVPFAWLALLDALEKLKDDKQVDSFQGIVDVARSVGLPSPGFALEDEVTFILLYFTELGSLSWFDEPGLSDLVILVSCRAVVILLQLMLSRIPTG